VDEGTKGFASFNPTPASKAALVAATFKWFLSRITTTREEDMNRYIIQQESSGWIWRLESDGWWWRRLYFLNFWLPTSGGPFATAEEAEQDARNNQFRRFSRGRPL
jgi:hypothetical protein